MPNFKHLATLVASFGYFPLLLTESNINKTSGENKMKILFMGTPDIAMVKIADFFVSCNIFSHLYVEGERKPLGGDSKK